MQTVLIRTREWTAWIPGRPDQDAPILIHDGITTLEIEDDEKLTEIVTTSIGKQRWFGIDVDGETVNVKFSLYAYQATIVRVAPEGFEIPEQPVENGEVAKPGLIAAPGQNREQRRKEK